VSNKFGALTCAQYFSKYLEKYSVRAKGGIADTDVNGNIRTGIYPSQTAGKAEDVEKLTIISTTESPTLKRIARVTNYDSDNFYAETLLRTVSKKRTGSAAYDSCGVAASKVFKDLGIDDSYGIDLVDGSGLSPQNKVTADFVCRYLVAVSKEPFFKEFLRSLSKVGENGTAKNLLPNLPASMAVRLKTGTMDGVKAYAGYVDTGNGDRLAFTIISNGHDASSSAAGEYLNRILQKVVSIY
jgi:D-alanyl-D-alanine carboxypeptidase/D-alanyl-D-alanine-endopeptidase (penicillin-binding protein 4)